jgi:hypothetical protein
LVGHWLNEHSAINQLESPYNQYKQTGSGTLAHKVIDMPGTLAPKVILIRMINLIDNSQSQRLSITPTSSIIQYRHFGTGTLALKVKDHKLAIHMALRAG